MVSGAAPTLTKIGFRRHVKLFLTILFGYLVVIILVLLFLLRNFVDHTDAVIGRDRESVADAEAAELGGPDRSPIESRLAALQTRYGIAGVTFIRDDRQQIAFGVPPGADRVESVARTIEGGRIVLVFDSTRLHDMRRTFWLTAIISLATAAAGAILLTLYVPRITRPIEAMLDSAAQLGERAPNVDEQEYLIATFRDSIGTMKKQEAELQRLYELQKTRADDLERVTSTLTRSMTSGFLALDPAGRVVDVNASARSTLGSQRPDVAGRDVIDAFGRNAVTEQVARAIEGRSAITRAEVVIGDGEEERIIGLTTVPLFGEERLFLGMIALFTDLTPIRALETRVRDMQTFADLGEISAGIAHEFRNSLATILGALRLALRESLPPDAARRVALVEAEAKALAETVDAFVSFARPLTLDPQRCDLRALAESVAGRIRGFHGDVAIDVGGEELEVDGDRVLLTRALENLIRNAVDSVRQSGRGGTVTVTTSRRDRTAAVNVADDGVGVDPAEVPRLFLPFRSSKTDGLGLGLPLAKKIALLHGGTVRLAPRAEGGAMATLELPAAGADT